MMKFFSVLAMVMLLLIPVAASATTLNLAGVSFPSEIFATLEFDYSAINDTAGQIDIDIANTSLVTSALTAIAFSAPSNVTGATNISAPFGWNIVYNPDSINTPGNFGFFDIAEQTGPTFGGGTPLYGIWDGDSANFLISVTGTGMLGLNDASFLSLLSDLDNSGIAQPFIARFQAIGPFDCSDVAVVPIPPAALLFGSGLLGLGIVGWRKRA